MGIKKKIVILSGAGISAESGIATFRDSNGLWENHAIEDVATPQGWQRNPDLVLEFYNQRRKQALSVKPNAGHLALVELEQKFEVQIVTQNVDNLHEQAGSSRVLHLHGKLNESRSTKDPQLVYPINGWELKRGDFCELGSQLRPNIVWFGEDVPMIVPAVEHAASADIFIVVGTSLLVYPAAGLVDYVGKNVPIFVIDPQIPKMSASKNVIFIEEVASKGLRKVVDELI
jgi:NAD-dependent deacetylase